MAESVGLPAAGSEDLCVGALPSVERYENEAETGRATDLKSNKAFLQLRSAPAPVQTPLEGFRGLPVLGQMSNDNWETRTDSQHASLIGPRTSSPSPQTVAGKSILFSSPNSITSRSAGGGASQELKHGSPATPPKGLSPNPAPPKWTTTPTPYATVANASPGGKMSPGETRTGDSFPENERRSSGDLSKEALAEALKKELRKSGELVPPKHPYARKRSSENLFREGGDRSQSPSKPPSAGSSKASSPKPAKQPSLFKTTGGDFSNPSSRRVSDGEEALASGWASEEGFRISSRLSQSGTPKLSRQSSANAAAYSRQSSLGSPTTRSEGSVEGGIRLLPRVSSGTNPFLTDAYGQDSPSASRRASSLPPPPTSPKKGVFEGFEQFVKVATPRASSEGSRRSSADVSRRASDVSRRASDVSRRSSDVSASDAPPFDLLSDEEDSCAPPIVVEISPPRRGVKSAQQLPPWQGLDSQFAPGTWELPEAGSEWLDRSPMSSPHRGRPEEVGAAVPPGAEILGTSPTRQIPAVDQGLLGGADLGITPAVPSASSAPNPLLPSASSALNPVLPSALGAVTQWVISQPASPAGNPFRAEYPDPFLAAFGANPELSPCAKPGDGLSRPKSLNPFLEPEKRNPSKAEQAERSIPTGLPNPFAPNHQEFISDPRKCLSTEISHLKPATGKNARQVNPATIQSEAPLGVRPLSSQNAGLSRSKTQPAPAREPLWETFSAETPAFNPVSKKVNPVLTRSLTEPPTAFVNQAVSWTRSTSDVTAQGGTFLAWEPFHTDVHKADISSKAVWMNAPTFQAAP